MARIVDGKTMFHLDFLAREIPQSPVLLRPKKSSSQSAPVIAADTNMIPKCKTLQNVYDSGIR